MHANGNNNYGRFRLLILLLFIITRAAMATKTKLAELNVPLQNFWQFVHEHQCVIDWGMEASVARSEHRTFAKRARK